MSARHGGLIVEQFRLGPLWNFSYLVWGPDSGEAIVIDPGREVDVVLARSEALRLRVTAAIVTHFHTDHTAGLAELVHRKGAAVVVHYGDEGSLRGHYRGPLRLVDDGDGLAIGDGDVELWHAPGHTPGSQWVVIDGAVFTGDALMVGCMGRTGAEEHAALDLWRTASAQFPRLPDATVIYPGHDYGPTPTSSAAIERERNACLRAATFEEFRDLLACQG